LPTSDITATGAVPQPRASRWLIGVAIVAAAALVYGAGLGRAPLYLGGDESHSAIEAYSIATTLRDHNGNRLPLFFNVENPLPDRHEEDRWWQPFFIYIQAAALKALPMTEASVRVPTVVLALLDLVLAFAIGARLFGGTLYPALTALLLATTPAHFIFGRMALDYFGPVPFTLGWLYCLVAFLDSGSLKTIAAGGAILGAGVYSHIAAWAFMPLFLALTCWAIWRSGHDSARAAGAAIAGFLLPVLPLLIWTRLHPEMLRALFGSYESPFMARLSTLQKIHEFLNYNNVQDKVGLYWNYWNPSFLFLAGGSNLGYSTRLAGVFLLPVAAFLAAGVPAALRDQRSRIAGGVLVAALLLVPVPAVLRGESQAIGRELPLVPIAVLVAIFGVRSILTNARPLARAAAVALLLAVPLQFAMFARDYFGDYQRRAAYWIDPIDFRDVAARLFDRDARSPLPLIYLSGDLDDGSTRWLFYLMKHHRQDLWPRTHDVDASRLVPAQVPGGTALVLYAGDPRIAALTRNGEFVLEDTIIHAGGAASAVILRRTGL
jgi:hypothetical protein